MPEAPRGAGKWGANVLKGKNFSRRANVLNGNDQESADVLCGNSGASPVSLCINPNISDLVNAPLVGRSWLINSCRIPVCKLVVSLLAPGLFDLFLDSLHSLRFLLLARLVLP